MTETHFFDAGIAEKYGINCAVILQNLWHWIRKNEANGTNFYDGQYWTYNSTKAFCKLFPYLSQRQIEHALKKLRDEGIIITGNYNAVQYDRTLWYAITEKGKSILHGCEMENTSEGNGFANDVKPIPDRNTDNKPNINTDRENPAQQVVDLYNSLCPSFPTVKVLSDSRKKAITARLKSYKLEDFKTVFENAEASSFLKGKNNRNWMANFDWMIKADNIPKILEGNYADRGKEKVPGWMGQRELDSDEMFAIRQAMAEDDSPPGLSPELEAEAERLRQRFAEGL